MGAPILQPTFTGGELSPSLYARVDLARYGTSLRKAKNFIVRPYGGVVNRPGFGYVGNTKAQTKRARLIPFEYSTEIAYVVELGHQYARFIYRGAYVESSPGVPAEVTTPWTEDQLREVAFTQSADVMYLVHPSSKPKELRRLTATTFELRDFVNKNGPFMAINSDESIKVAISAETGNVSIQASTDIFTADMVGSLFYVEEKDLRGQRPWEAGWRDVAVGTLCRSDGKVYRASAIPSGSTTWKQTGGIRPIHDSGRAWDGPQDERTSGTDTYAVGVEWEYLHSGFGIVKITGYTDANTVTGVVTSRIPASCVGGLGSPATTWTLSGNGSTKTFAIAGAVSDSNADYTVTIDGVPVQPDPYYTPPSGTGGGGDIGGCVTVDTLVIAHGRGIVRAGDVTDADWLLRGDGSWGRVSYSQERPADCVRIVDNTLAALECSTTAPIQSGDRFHLAPEMFGRETPRWTMADGKLDASGERMVIDIARLGERMVQHITLVAETTAETDRVFLASADGVNWWGHHNAKRPPEG